MRARVIHTQLKPGKEDEAIRIFKESALPVLREQPGLGSVVLLADRAASRGMTLSLWESAEAIQAAEAKGIRQQIMAKFADVYATEPSLEEYDVSVRVRPSTDDISHSRVVTVQIKPDRLDEAIALYEDSVVPAAKEQDGFLGTLLLTDRSSGKGLSITAWASEESLRASDSGGYLRAQFDKFRDIFAQPPSTEVYEVVLASIR